MNKFLKIISAIAITQSAGLIGSVFTVSSMNSWYADLNKPFFNPPGFVFGPVWIFLYTLIGISLFLAWEKKINLKWFWIQLFLNATWSIVFFGLNNPFLALLNIILLIISIIMTIKVFLKKDRRAAFILYPYLAWVSFAAILNLSIVILN